ncbi:octanoyltransferase [Arabidopsis thaliana]|uniref:Octanoyltransferase n=1 Tax=Arabidopsis thaliana TaxID=3702 RepID=F4K0V9_ARATH|nr:octanoyltransferase [Arabidopsis thaliana]AED91781.2 octanoyltransferase [Arabidopsis thaliana]|eukprot:NP_001318548.1 octanoyltransferase [Arabidopsis thaliana]
MDDQEFRSLLDLFPVVRSRDHRAELDSSKQSTSQSVVDREVSEWHDAPTVAEPKDLQYLKTDQGWWG